MADQKLTDLPVYGATMDGTEVMYVVPASGISSNQITTAKLIEDLNNLTSLDELGDVTVSTPSTGEVLTRNSGNNGWENAPLPPTSVTSLDDVGDVSVPSPSNNEVLTWQTNAWVAQTPAGGGDVTGPAGGVVDNEIALYDQATGKIIKGSGGALLTDYAKVAETITEDVEDTHPNPVRYAIMPEASHPGAGADPDVLYFLT